MINALYIFGGIAFASFGIWLTIKQIKIFVQGKQGSLGFDIQLLSGGLMAIILGIALIVNHI